MKFKELECEFDYQGASYAACADVDVLTEERDIGPQGHREHYLAQVPVEAKHAFQNLLKVWAWLKNYTPPGMEL